MSLLKSPRKGDKPEVRLPYVGLVPDYNVIAPALTRRVPIPTAVCGAGGQGAAEKEK